MSEALQLRFEACVVEVAADAEDLRWLGAFGDGSFEEGTGASSPRRVELVVDPAAHARRLESGRAGSGAKREGFANDSNPAHFERWPSPGAERVFYDERREIFYAVSGDADRVEMLVRERTPKCRTALMRVVRELVLDHVVATGGLLLHGSAVDTGAGVVAMCGPRRSGKTTLLMSLLSNGGVAYVANDRCVLRADGGGASLRGLPTLVSIRRDALDRFPDARGRLAAVRPDLAGAWPVGRSGFSLSPPAFRELVGTRRVSAGGPLRALVFPRVTSDPARLALRRMGAAEVRERFASALFRASHASPLGEVFASSLGAERGLAWRERAARVGRRLAESVPCFDGRLGGGGPPDPAACRELLAEVTAAPARDA